MGLTFLGIDPGLRGAAAIVAAPSADRVRFVEVIDFVIKGEGAARRVDEWCLLDFIAKHKPERAVIERAQAGPHDGRTSAFTYGRAVGVLEACVRGMGIPLDVIESRAWKKWHMLDRKNHQESEGAEIKEASRLRALGRFPAARSMLARKLDHNRAEAILMADYGIIRALTGQGTR